jgi:hypothetical protein
MFSSASESEETQENFKIGKNVLFESRDTFDSSNYIVLFESIFTVPAMSNAFYHFLKKEQSDQNWEFLNDIKVLESQLIQKMEAADIITIVKEIVNKYFQTEDSEKLLNLPGKIKI